MAKHNEIGVIGERIAENFLKKKDFVILARNYRKKWGELDIVALKDNKVYFVEVKTVSRIAVNGKFPLESNNYRPEDNMHPWKIRRLSRAVQTYLLENSKKIAALAKASAGQAEWQFDLICVFLDKEAKISKIRYIENIVL